MDHFLLNYGTESEEVYRFKEMNNILKVSCFSFKKWLINLKEPGNYAAFYAHCFYDIKDASNPDRFGCLIIERIDENFTQKLQSFYDLSLEKTECAKTIYLNRS